VRIGGAAAPCRRVAQQALWGQELTIGGQRGQGRRSRAEGVLTEARATAESWRDRGEHQQRLKLSVGERERESLKERGEGAACSGVG
jgi:hypothetical protein